MTRKTVDLGLRATRVGGSACIPYPFECGIAAIKGIKQPMPRSVQKALLCRADLRSMSVVDTYQRQLRGEKNKELFTFCKKLHRGLSRRQETLSYPHELDGHDLAAPPRPRCRDQ